jgi:hypothetical protein
VNVRSRCRYLGGDRQMSRKPVRDVCTEPIRVPLNDGGAINRDSFKA